MNSEATILVDMSLPRKLFAPASCRVNIQ